MMYIVSSPEIMREGGDDGKTQTTVLDRVRRVLGARRTADSAARVATAAGQVRPQARRWAQAKSRATGVRGDRVCVAHRLPMESVAPGTVWQRQRDPQAV